MKQAETGGNGMGRKNHRFRVAVTGITTGKLVDMGTKDSMNMGAAMAPAAWNTICQNFEDFGVGASYYDRIITGDLGAVGQKALLDFMKSSGHDITGKHMDCGLEIYDRGEQDVHSGGSGCGCSAVTLCAPILPKLMRGAVCAHRRAAVYRQLQRRPEHTGNRSCGDAGTDGGVKKCVIW